MSFASMELNRSPLFSALPCQFVSPVASDKPSGHQTKPATHTHTHNRNMGRWCSDHSTPAPKNLNHASKKTISPSSGALHLLAMRVSPHRHTDTQTHTHTHTHTSVLPRYRRACTSPRPGGRRASQTRPRPGWPPAEASRTPRRRGSSPSGRTCASPGARQRRRSRGDEKSPTKRKETKRTAV